MKIVVDMQGAQTESRLRGIGRYTMSLAKAIIRNAGEHDVWLIVNKTFSDSADVIAKEFTGIIAPEKVLQFCTPGHVSWESSDNKWRRSVAERIRNNFISQLAPDVVLVSSLFEGANNCNAVISVSSGESQYLTSVVLYDLIPLMNPDEYLSSGWAKDWYMDKVESLARADVLLSISESARQEGLQQLGFDGDRIVNISTAHDSKFICKQYDDTFKNTLFTHYGISSPYLMYNGALEQRKNLDGLIRAFSLLPVELQSKYQLVFVGKVSDFESYRLARLARELGVNDSFVLTGRVSDEELVALFNLATLFVFPSLHEGFGLPALEAMACGTPTIGSNVTSIPEVIGRDDALFDPNEPQDIARKITEVLSDERFLDALKKHAFKQVKLFSWDVTAKKAIEAFEEKFAERTTIISKDWSYISDEKGRLYNELVKDIASFTNSNSDLVPSDVDLMKIAECISHNSVQADAALRRIELPEHLNWKVEGPFDTSYSLSLLNRETARALAALGHFVCLGSTDGYTDLEPSNEFLSDNPDIAEFYERDKNNPKKFPLVVSRNLYPPRVYDMHGRINLLHHYAWEETGFPEEWVESFNSSLQGLTCLSHHVEKIMIDHGVTIPLSVSGCGVDHWLRIVRDQYYKIDVNGFCFLHVSSCFPRKGVEVLLESFGRSFKKSDNVTLVIKTFSNPHNKIEEWLAVCREHVPDYPDVLVIDDDLTDGQMKALYEQCDALVAPSFAEGFGLPMAEAMLSGLPVITTGWGGQMDFCTEETAWLIDYSFERADTHFKLFDSVWAKPDVEHLAMILQEVYQLPPDRRLERATLGKERLLNDFRWSDVAKRLVSSVKVMATIPRLPELRVGWVSTWNSLCGIAMYSEHIVGNFPGEVSIFAPRNSRLVTDDDMSVARCWDAGNSDSLFDLSQSVAEKNINTLVIQFNYSLFDFESLNEFINKQLDVERIVVLVLHSTSDPIEIDPTKRLAVILPALVRCQRILVHTPADMNRLNELGLVDNVTLFPHGIRSYTMQELKQDKGVPEKREGSFVVASYGFFLPHKGLMELIDAIAVVRSKGYDVFLQMVNAQYPVPESSELVREAKSKITALGLDDCIKINTAFLNDKESISILSEADLIAFPYQETGESSSAAVRSGLSALRPVVVTPLPIFDDVATVVHKFPGCSSNEIAQGIIELSQAIRNERSEINKVEEEAHRWRETHDYVSLGHRLYGMLQALARKA